MRAVSSGSTELHSALKSSGPSPNSRITVASPKSPVAGSPVRLKATAPTQAGLRDRASARITAAFGLEHWTASAGVVAVAADGPDAAVDLGGIPSGNRPAQSGCLS